MDPRDASRPIALGILVLTACFAAVSNPRRGSQRAPALPIQPAGPARAAEPPASSATLEADRSPPARPRTDRRGESRTPLRAAADAPGGARAAPAAPAAVAASLEVVVLAADGRRVPAATVELRHASTAGREEVACFVADARGRLALPLDAGSVHASAWSGAAAGGPITAELAAGRPTRATIRLQPTTAVRGRIVDTGTQQPIAHARVSFWTFAERDVVRTDAGGVFEHPRFPAGGVSQQVRVEADGYGPCVRYLHVADDGSWSFPSPVARPGEGEGPSGHGDPWVEIELVPELVLSGRIVTPQRTPVAGAEVSAEGFFHVLPSVASRDEAAAVCDDEGRFRLDGLRSDVGHGLWIRAPGFAARTVEVDASGGVERTLDEIVLEPETTLAGTVLDPTGQPVVDALVRLLPASTPESGVLDRDDGTPSGSLDVDVRIQGHLHEARTGVDGTFLFEGLTAERYRVQVARDRGTLAEVVVHPFEPEARGLVLPLSPACLTLVGEVRDAHGTVAGARVELERDGLVGRVWTDADGRFRISGLDDHAAYRLLATASCSRSGQPLAGRSDAWAFGTPIVRLAPRE